METTSQDPPSSRFNPEDLPRSSQRWESWLRMFLSFLLGAISAAFFIGGKSRDVSDLLQWKGEAIAKLNQMAERFERMDSDGTKRSHWVYDQQSREIETNRARIVELERRAELRGEVINVIQGKIERIESELKRQP